MKKTYVFLYLIIALLFNNLQAQNSLQGVIKDKETGQPIPGAVVYLAELKQGTTAQENGTFELDDLPAGNFLVEIRSIGYNSYIHNILIKGKVELKIELEESAVEMNEVVVTGSVSTTQKMLNPIPTYSVEKSQLQHSGSSNIIEALTKVPGVFQISTGPAISKPVIRGLGYNRVLVLHDDIRQEGQQWGDEHGVEIDDKSIDKVEIIKGPGSLAYGSDALAGVVNFISAPTLSVGQIRGNVSMNYQTNNALMDYYASNQGNIKGFNWLVQGTYKLAGNYSNRYDGKVYNSGFNEKNLSGYLGLTKRWGFSFLRFSTFNQHLGLIEGERDSEGRFTKLVSVSQDQVEELPATNNDLNAYRIDVPKQTIRHNRIQLNSKILLGNSSVQADIGFQQNLRQEFSDPLAPKNPELAFQLNSFNYNLKYNFPETGGWHHIAGISGMIQKNENQGDEKLIPDYNLNDAGVFFTTSKTWESTHFSAGLRIDNRHINSRSLLKDRITAPIGSGDYKFEGFKKNITNTSFGLGISRNVSSTIIVKANFSNGFRAPNLAELATNGKHEGTFRYEYGNKNLKAETSQQADLGLSYMSKHIALEVSPFLNNVQNFIYIKKLVSITGGDSIPDTEDPSPAFKYTQGNAVLYGGEISLDIHPHPYDFIHIKQSLSLVRGILRKQADSTRNLPMIPPVAYQFELKIQPTKTALKLSKPYMLVEYNYIFEQNRVYSAFGTETRTPGYGLLNIGIGADFTRKDKEPLCSIHILVTNLMDVAYQNHLSRLKYAPENPVSQRMGIYNMGRNISFSMDVPIKMSKK
jgi:iron complex outermembrane recepter protein